MSEPLLIELSKKGRKAYCFPALDLPRGFESALPSLPSSLLRQTKARLPEVSELDVVRHFTRLSTLSFGVDNGCYPLGSCTMKYNPKISEKLAMLEDFTTIHPLQDSSTVQGCLSVMYNLLEDLSSITGMSWGTLQPCAGAHGEYTGLKMVRAYFLKKGEARRNKVLVPVSAHGTNPASAALNGFTIVTVASDDEGLVDIDDLKSKLDDSVAAFMLTNPNTLGLFEKNILLISSLVHEAGGLLYYDGANLNAIMGNATPSDMGFDLLHLNLHKTFATPHGGGGPGSGPVMVKSFLRPFLPGPDIELTDSGYTYNWLASDSIGKVSMFWGNFLVLVKAYIYILRMGSEGLRAASSHAVLNANYMLHRLKGTFEIPYGDTCMHEFVISCQNFKQEYGVSAEDIAKGLIDSGYHPPTMYFPSLVHEALMIEPTESESKETLDEFTDTLIGIAERAKKDPQWIHGCPWTTPVGRLDTAKAVKEPDLHY
ncbi:glycine cleavage system protein P [Sphaerochaeta pleomorpha str. Grapes]|uniref:glycine dehydrogenase (aminomethyl-transferring) n=1 Tax=Sphaerochaeta pleomorpha (strain ATCC BAA-1885 / DSM 22778 / Grapes) TaxID=158190 RepID=G8QVW5_SPHPG|nr:aminomethyl-transferring glycine dehydrogenase subunit GcvPB [Sphaerochaeta pleomorpha]AEV30489.1 glycine cleavage system protein P [Sphaerochaeta pleomorpha str. Grapes]